MPHPGIDFTLRIGTADSLGDDLGRKIEEWIVSNLDDRTSANDRDWMGSLERFNLAKRPSKTSTKAPNTQITPGGWARFRLSRRKGITVVTLTDQALIKEQDLAELSGDLLALIEAGHRHLVLDFTAVERLSSWAASAIARTVRACSSAEGGAVKVSGLRPEVGSIFVLTGLDRQVTLCSDAASALAGDWPVVPDLRPLPISILAALMRAEHAHPHTGPVSDPSGRAAEDYPPMTAARLIVQGGPSMGRPVAIRGPRFLIGRGPGCQVRLGSATVSRSHAAIERRGSRLFLRDLASMNGTLLNGRLLRDAEAEIRDGDQIRIGPLDFALAMGPGGSRLEPFEDPVDGESRSLYRGGATFDEFPAMTEEFVNFGGDGEDLGLKYEIIEGILVVTPLTSQLDGEPAIDALRDSMSSLFDRRLPRKVVVNLKHVSHLSGRAIGLLVAHHLRLDRSGGALRVCLANPRVAVVLEQVRLAMLVDCHQDVEEAILAAWPHANGEIGGREDRAGRP